jgi:GTP:adenosylcobinamide-phosphate guanylyltransferase
MLLAVIHFGRVGESMASVEKPLLRLHHRPLFPEVISEVDQYLHDVVGVDLSHMGMIGCRKPFAVEERQHQWLPR